MEKIAHTPKKIRRRFLVSPDFTPEEIEKHNLEVVAARLRHPWRAPGIPSPLGRYHRIERK